MPSYITNPQVGQVDAIYPGFNEKIVDNAAVDTGVTTTIQTAIGPVPGNSVGNLMITNSTNQPAIGQYSALDVAANYEPLSGCVVPAGSSLPYNLSGGWIRFTFGTAPTSGSLILSR